MARPPRQSLVPKQEEAIAALLTFPTVRQAAESLAIGERTLHRWLSDDQRFIAAYHQARRISFAQAIAQAQRLVPVAINTLGQIMTDKSVAASARVTAAVAIANICRQSIELDELAERVTALEAASAAQKDALAA